MKRLTMVAGLMALMFAGPAWAGEPSRLFMVGPYLEDAGSSGRLTRVSWTELETGGSAPGEENKWGGWGGFSIGWFVPDLEGFQGMTEERGLDGFESPLRVWQGRGFVSVNGLRIGGSGGGGSFYEVESINGDERWASLDIVYGGFYVGYMMPVTEQLGVFGGVTLGGGMAWMAADGHDIDDYWSQFETFDYTAPEAGISIKVAQWLRVEASAQYNDIGLDTNGSSFYAANGEKMVDMSNLSGPSYHLWFLFGYGG